MALTTDEPHPRSVAIRQDVQVITQTLGYEHSTFATYVTLGGQATSTTQATVHHESPGGLSDAQVGAIAGSVVGVFLIVFTIFCCCFRRRRPTPVRVGYRPRSRSSHSGSYIVDDVPGPLPPKEFWPRPPSVHRHRPRTPSVRWPSPMQRPNPMQRPSPMQRPASVPWPPPVAERIPGGPKFPTYRALPIPNPRKPVHIP